MAYSAGTFSLEIEGQFAGYLNTVEGGEPFGTVALEVPDANKVVRKHLGSINYTPIQLSFGSAMEQPLYQWMVDMLRGAQSPRNGAVVFYDYNMTEKERIEFTRALITRLVFPELDAASAEPALFRVTLQPETTHLNRTTAGSKAAAHPVAKRGLASNFRLAINNLTTNRISRIESMVASQSIQAANPAEVREPGLSLQPLEISNLVFSLAEADSAPMYAWSDDFFVAGHHLNTDERSGTLDLLDATLSNSLLRLTLSNIGLVRVQRRTQVAGSGLVASVRVEAYVEQLSLPPEQQANAPGGRVPPVALKSILETVSARSKQESARTIKSAAASAKSLDPVAIAQRFKAAPSAVQVNSLHDAGMLIGSEWASQVASLDEARQLADLTSRDWDAVRLAQGNSLVAKLVDEGLLQPNQDGPIDLARDGFTEGLITGASRVMQRVLPVLDSTAVSAPTDSRTVSDLDQAMAAVKDSLDALGDIGEADSLRLQMVMDRMSKFMSTLSNMLKKASDTASSISQNIK